MSIQIENGVKVLVSAALATALTLIVITGIGNSAGQQLAQRAAALSAQSPAAVIARQAG